MVGSTSETRETTYLRRDRAPCKRCGDVIETDVPACPHCGNRPLAGVKAGSVALMFVGTILALPLSHGALAFWVGSLVGVLLFCVGVGVYWVVTERYSPTEYDASERSIRSRAGTADT